MNTKHHPLTAAIIAASIAGPAFAETPAQAKTYEDEIFVSGLRSPQLITESLQSISVVTDAQIEKSQAVDLPQLLIGLPGLDLDHNGGRGSTTSIRVRGTESDQVLVLVDGVRVGSASNGQAAIQHIPINLIERVEIVRGPRSSLYGADAIGGVIQIFTKKGENATKGFSPTITVEYGSHNTQITELGVSGRTDNTYYSLNLGHEETDGINRTVGRTGADADRDGYRETSFSSSVGHTFDNDANLEARYLRSEGTSEFDSGGTDETDFLNDSANLHLTLPLTQALTTRVDIGRARDERETFSAFASTFDTERDSASVQFDYRVGDDQKIIAGYDYYDDQVESTAGFTEESRDNNALFAQYLADYGLFSLETGIRNDDNEAFGSKTTGSATVSVDLSESLILTVSYGTAFKAPTFNDLYFPFTDFGFGFTFEGNPNLDPESSKSWEVLLKQQAEKVSWSVALYRTDIEDLISLTSTSVENIAEAEIRGVEAAARFALYSWEIDLSLEYLDAVNGQTNARLDNRSRTRSGVELSRRFGRFDFAVSWRFQGNRVDGGEQLGSYALTNIRVNYQATDKLTMGFNVRNLFDKDYTLISGSRTFRTEGQTASIFARYDL